MDEQVGTEQTPEQNNADFMAGFNAVMPSDDNVSPEVNAPAKVEDQSAVTAKEEVSPPEQETADQEEQTYFGMSESQIKSLLERAARVDSLEEQIRKAHGKIGELNSTMQSKFSQKQPTQEAPAVEIEDETLNQWASEFPEVSAIARKIAGDMLKEHAQANGQPTPELSREEILRDANVAIMDATHDGWRETIQSQDFSLWIATQPEDVQEEFNNTISAKVMGGILNAFEGWKAKTQDRSAKNKTRLEQALIPSGSTSKVAHAPSATDEFLAGFNSVRSKY